MTDVATRQDIDEVIGIMRDFMAQVDERFGRVEKQLGEVQQEIIDLKRSHDRLLNTVDGFISRIDRYETEMTARDSQFQKLLEWARKVSEKTGIPLENL